MLLQKLWSVLQNVEIVVNYLIRRYRMVKLVQFPEGLRLLTLVLMVQSANGQELNEELLKLILNYPHLLPAESVVKSAIIDVHNVQMTMKFFKWMVKNKVVDWYNIHGILLRMDIDYYVIDLVRHREISRYVREQLNGTAGKTNPLEPKSSNSRVRDPNDEKRIRNCCVTQ